MLKTVLSSSGKSWDPHHSRAGVTVPAVSERMTCPVAEAMSERPNVLRKNMLMIHNEMLGQRCERGSEKAKSALFLFFPF